MKKPHLKKQQPADAKAMMLEASMDHFVRIQEHQREFLDWLKGQEETSPDNKAFEAIR